MEDDSIINSIKACRELMIKINELLGGEKYRMRRVGSNPIVPMTEDENITRGILTYDCLYELKTDRIYKK